MPCHRLIPCDLDHALSAAVARHAQLSVHAHRVGRSARLGWWSRLAANTISWTLEIDQGATGVLVHLTAEPVSGPLLRLSWRARAVLLRPFSVHELTELARMVSVNDQVRG